MFRVFWRPVRPPDTCRPSRRAYLLGQCLPYRYTIRKNDCVPQRVDLVALDVRWEPNAPDAVLARSDRGGATLALRAHPDDDDQRTVILSWTGCVAAVDGPYNDEARHRHPLYGIGLMGVLWIGEVHRSVWLETISSAIHPNAARGLRHFVLPLKERTIEVAARAVEVSRSDLSPSDAAVDAL